VGTDIYVFGGEDADAESIGVEMDCVYKYDTLANAWSTLAPMPHTCSYHSASVCNGLVYIVGVGVDGEEVLRFDPASAEWSTLCSTNYTRRGGESFILGGIMYVAGGGGIIPVWTAMTPMLTRGRRWRTCSRDALRSEPSPSGPRAQPRSRISSSLLSTTLPDPVGYYEWLASQYHVLKVISHRSASRRCSCGLGATRRGRLRSLTAACLELEIN
jgi:hypothetical protein